MAKGIKMQNFLYKENVKAFYPRSLNEVEEIINYLKTNPLILSLVNLKNTDKQRALDLVCGACYSLNKNVCKLDKNNFLFIEKTSQ